MISSMYIGQLKVIKSTIESFHKKLKFSAVDDYTNGSFAYKLQNSRVWKSVVGNFYRPPRLLLSNTSIYWIAIVLGVCSLLLLQIKSPGSYVRTILIMNQFLYHPTYLKTYANNALFFLQYHQFIIRRVTAISIQTYYLTHIKIIIKISFDSISLSGTSPPSYALLQ